MQLLPPRITTPGELLFHARNRLEMTQNEVAKQLGINSGEISHVETNYSMASMERLKQYAKIYKLSQGEIKKLLTLASKDRYSRVSIQHLKPAQKQRVLEIIFEQS